MALFQSTHPHGVRRLCCWSILHTQLVSIHAPARGATMSKGNQMSIFDVSIHAPARGATHCCAIFTLDYCFNPRTRTGCDLRIALNLRFANDVSIHAPARGATHLRSFRCVSYPSFNPRTRTGCDRFAPGKVQEHRFVSIHAPARGATEQSFPCPPPCRVSIHAPARGATVLSNVLPNPLWFQSTHPHGVRRLA